MTTATAFEVVIGTLAILVLASVLFAWVRRLVLSSSHPLLLCALRPEGASRWRLGLARLHSERFEWFSVFGPSFRPEESWSRLDLDLRSPQRLEDPVPGLVDPVCVEGHGPAGNCGLAFDEGSYRAVRAWLESAPPGQNVHVA